MFKVETEVGGRTLTIATGEWAKQANGSCTVKYGDTMILCAVTMGEEKASDFMPLTVDYREMTYAAGKIPGGFFKREGRPRDSEILTGRLVDRAIRPLFPKDFAQEVLVSILVLSSDVENKADILSLIGAAAALMVSDIPFETAIAGCRVGYKDGNFIINPVISEIEECLLEVIVAGTKNGITMLEGGAGEADEETLVAAVEKGKHVIDGIIAILEELRGKCGREKVKGARTVRPPEDFQKKVLGAIRAKLIDSFKEKSHSRRRELVSAVKAECALELD
ncbi:MAG: polyribonucleotide nucleotidyltransferase, partial [Elusimicrobia bacterium CG08_land_8_20_14_0_20_44_26]